MRLLGYEIALRKAAGSSPGYALAIQRAPANLQAVQSRSSWFNWGAIHESFTGAWQQNVTIDPQTSILAFSAVFSCVTGIASDVAKMRIKLDEDKAGIWKEIISGSPWLHVLRKPNHYQNRIKFIEQWIVSKLLHGNAYILKQRNDLRGIVTAMYVLDPTRVTPLVAEDGSVYYRLGKDHLSQVAEDDVVVPASEIIHDTMVCLWHPLVGISPIYACGLSATQGNRIQNSQTAFFGNASRPSGVLTAPGAIADDTALRLKTHWETNYSGVNVGRVAVLGDGLKFDQMVVPAQIAQLIEQLRWTVEDVGRTFHYPQWKLGGPLPPYSSGPEALTMMYYTDCLQALIESIELCLDEGLELPSGMGTEMDLDNLWRMDTKSLFEASNLMVAGGWGKPNEARFKANLPEVEGGDTPYLQEQNYSLAALAKRDALDNPFSAKTPETAAPPPATDPPEPSSKDLEELEVLFEVELRKELTPA